MFMLGAMTSSKDAAAESVDLQLIGVLGEVVTAYYRDFADAAAEQGLTSAQAKAVVTLQEPTPMRTLAERLCCDASNVTGIIDRLERQSLVQRQPDQHDRRVKNVVVTEGGADAVRRLRGGMHATRAAFDALGEDDRATLLRLLGTLQPLLDTPT